ncbi:hypothetical protein N7468_009461 [Penicillium chermesinum]|uniref:Zn(2)-C6 fungal-type domain-containing protein n=1 Tax=Penicillium chermesinum TaxID=63820 RepID=A0A9W9NHW1_9EURO|nr:uncharacterized protein N7468_009461 [Penicillium chermesinum]KAJ5220257.1 hypothetical protein N7468_009461 [Penicillium chermesinum]
MFLDLNMSQNLANSKGPLQRAPQRNRHGPRMILACLNCKDRKLRCDEQVPACNNCRRFGIVCLVEDPATKRHQPRNYLETLEHRVAQLEGILQRQSNHDASHGDSHHELSLSDLPYDFMIGAATSEDAPRYASQSLPPAVETQESLEMNDLVSKVGMLNVAAGAEPHYLGPSSAVNFCRIISPALLQAVPRRPDSGLGQQSEPAVPYACPFPDARTCLQMSDAYFQHIHPQYPFLHEPTFRGWEAKLFLSEAPDPSDLDSKSTFFLYMRLCASAELHVQDVLRLECLETVQAYLCYAIYSLRSPTGTSVWRFSGLALRQAIELGYHRHGSVLGLSTGTLRFELRKRAFWCAWTIDTVAATVLGRPLCLRSEDVDCELPSDIDDEYITDLGNTGQARGANNPPTRITKGLFTFRLRRLWARIHASLYSDLSLSNPSHPTYQARVAGFRDELEKWRASLPFVTLQKDEPRCLFTSSYWDIFEALAARTMTMLVEKSQENLPLPVTGSEADLLDPAMLLQWKADIFSQGMSSSFEELLNGLIHDVPH